MKILIADDHTLFRDTLNTYLERLDRNYDIDLAADLDGAVSHIKNSRDEAYDIVILDLCMPGMNGFEGLKQIKSDYPDLIVAIISGVAQDWEVSEALQNGAAGFFPKAMSGRALVHAIELVSAGERFVPVEYIAPPVHNPKRPNSTFEQSEPAYKKAGGFSDQSQAQFDLTRRENDVLRLLSDGSSNKDIADALGLKIVTIKLHVRSICRKIGAKNRTQAALYAHKNNLYPN